MCWGALLFVLLLSACSTTAAHDQTIGSEIAQAFAPSAPADEPSDFHASERSSARLVDGVER
jgi:hypothetical protein